MHTWPRPTGPLQTPGIPIRSTTFACSAMVPLFGHVSHPALSGKPSPACRQLRRHRFSCLVAPDTAASHNRECTPRDNPGNHPEYRSPVRSGTSACSVRVPLIEPVSHPTPSPARARRVGGSTTAGNVSRTCHLLGKPNPYSSPKKQWHRQPLPPIVATFQSRRSRRVWQL